MTKKLKKLLAKYGLPDLRGPEALDTDAPHQKYLKKDGTEVSGTTTFTGLLVDEDLFNWVAYVTRSGNEWRFVRNSAGRVGTVFHHHAHRKIAGVKGAESIKVAPDEAEKIRNAVANWDRWWADESERITPIAVERQLVSEAHGYGGTLDLIAANEGGHLCLYDWKTSSSIKKKLNYWVQMAAYISLWNENFPELEITKVNLVRIGKKKEEGVEIESRSASVLSKELEIFFTLLRLGKLIGRGK
jgi:hypothetical protein